MDRRFLFGGWAAFSFSGVLYLLSGIRTADPWAIAGSIVWLVGVGLFLLALLRPE